MEKAVQIEKAFHSLYAESDKFNNKNRLFMEKHGYVECAFGLKLRTPIILNISQSFFEFERNANSKK